MAGGVPLDPARKVLTRDEARRWREQRTGAVVFTNGVFDVLHRGHVAYLARARAEGDALVVGVNTDASARRLGKGPDRPVNAGQDRAFVLAGLECVDAVVLFDEDTPLELIRRIGPDVLVKGGDWEPDRIVGADVVRKSGGTVRSLSFEGGYSTTSIVERIRRTAPRRG